MGLELDMPNLEDQIFRVAQQMGRHVQCFRGHVW